MGNAVRIKEADLKALGYVEHHGVFYPPGSPQAALIESNFQKPEKKCRKRRKGSRKSGKISRKPENIDLFIRLVKQELGLTLVTEHEFHPVRRWRFDYACLEHKIAIEQEGGIWMKGGGAHSRPQNIKRDMEKYTAASALGWRLIRVTPDELLSNYTLQQLKDMAKTDNLNLKHD